MPFRRIQIIRPTTLSGLGTWIIKQTGDDDMKRKDDAKRVDVIV